MNRIGFQSEDHIPNSLVLELCHDKGPATERKEVQPEAQRQNQQGKSQVRNLAIGII
jgi:hypothetical protein